MLQYPFCHFFFGFPCDICSTFTLKETVTKQLETQDSEQKLSLTTIQVILNYQYVINMNINILELNSEAYQPSLPYSMAQLADPRINYIQAQSQLTREKPTKQPNMQSHQAHFKTEKVLYSTEDTEVLLMEDTREGRLFVTKMTRIPKLNSSLSLHLDYETQFYTRLNAMDVSHIAKINKFERNQTVCTRIMEFACRGDISKYVDDAAGCCSLEQKMQHLAVVKNILWQVVKGMEEAHNLGFALRDIKPDNILINHEGQVLLCDFGLVAPFGDIDSSICGTPEYMAPERLSKRRSTLPIQPEIDYWSLGVLAFELLMGYTPYAYVEDDLDGLLESMYGGYISFDQQYPHYCKRFIYSLLQTNPGKRLSLSKIKQHQFFNDLQQQGLYDQRCKCTRRTDSC